MTIPATQTPPAGTVLPQAPVHSAVVGLPPLTIVAYGQPAPQGSKRHVGNGRMVESSKAVKPWREAVKSAALEVMDGAPALDGPLVVSMVFTLRKPASAPKKRRTWPDRTPDLSKLCRATEDALTDAGVWADDARVVEYQRLAKVFPGEDVAALHIPGAVVTVAAVAPPSPPKCSFCGGTETVRRPPTCVECWATLIVAQEAGPRCICPDDLIGSLGGCPAHDGVVR